MLWSAGRQSKVLLTRLCPFVSARSRRPFVHTSTKMANSRFEYIREYEESTEHSLMPDTFFVIRVDGKQFHRFTKEHNYHKPNDKRGLDLMNEAAKHVMKEFFPEIVISYGQSDEYSFVFHKRSRFFNRRQNKLISIVVSAFSSAFVFHWPRFFGPSAASPHPTPLHYPPSFDSRCVLYPTESDVIDYLKWRQVDCHINNVYNTTFYALTQQYVRWNALSRPDSALEQNGSVDGGTGGDGEDNKSGEFRVQTIAFDCPPLTPQQAEDRLKGSLSQEKKHEILKPVYGIDYERELEQFRRGSLIVLDRQRLDVAKVKLLKANRKRDVRQLQQEVKLRVLSEDLIVDQFWQRNVSLLESIELS